MAVFLSMKDQMLLRCLNMIKRVEKKVVDQAVSMLQLEKGMLKQLFFDQDIKYGVFFTGDTDPVNRLQIIDANISGRELNILAGNCDGAVTAVDILYLKKIMIVKDAFFSTDSGTMISTAQRFQHNLNRMETVKIEFFRKGIVLFSRYHDHFKICAQLFPFF